MKTTEPLSTSLLLSAQLLAVVARLRNPQNGCPWDLKQTHASLKPYLLEESYETLEAIDALGTHPTPTQIAHFKEELGDVLLQVALHSQIAQDNGWFDFEAVAGQLAEKLVRRHPHVFGEGEHKPEIQSAEGVSENWQRLKALEKPTPDTPNVPQSILSEVSRAQPALSRAKATSKIAVSAGFAWPNFDSLWQCVCSELEELKAELPAEIYSAEKPVLSATQQDRLEDELGDLLLATVSLAGHLQLDPEVALTRAVDKFTRRFKAMEGMVDTPSDPNHPKSRFAHLDFVAWDTLWKQAKAQDLA